MGEEMPASVGRSHWRQEGRIGDHPLTGRRDYQRIGFVLAPTGTQIGDFALCLDRSGYKNTQEEPPAHATTPRTARWSPVAHQSRQDKMGPSSNFASGLLHHQDL